MKKKLEERDATKTAVSVDINCRVCDNTFTSKQQLKRHVETLHGELMKICQTIISLYLINGSYNILYFMPSHNTQTTNNTHHTSYHLIQNLRQFIP